MMPADENRALVALERRVRELESFAGDQYQRLGHSAPAEMIRVETYDDLPTDKPLGTFAYVTGEKDGNKWVAEAGTLPPHGIGYYQYEQVRDEWQLGAGDDPTLDTFKNKWMPMDTPLYVRVMTVMNDVLVCVWVDPVTFVPYLPPNGPQITVMKPYHFQRRWFAYTQRPLFPGLFLAPEVEYHEDGDTEGRQYKFEQADRSRNAWIMPDLEGGEPQYITPDYAKDEVLSIVRCRQRVPAWYYPPDFPESLAEITFARWEDMNTAGRSWAAVGPGSQQ